jgi:hypothetical protein
MNAAAVEVITSPQPSAVPDRTPPRRINYRFPVQWIGNVPRRTSKNLMVLLDFVVGEVYQNLDNEKGGVADLRDSDEPLHPRKRP